MDPPQQSFSHDSLSHGMGSGHDFPAGQGITGQSELVGGDGGDGGDGGSSGGGSSSGL